MSLIMAKVSTARPANTRNVLKGVWRATFCNVIGDTPNCFGDHLNARATGDSQCLTDALRQLRRQKRPTRRGFVDVKESTSVMRAAREKDPPEGGGKNLGPIEEK